ncbi:MAG: hypothetical protein ACREGB_04770 [Candidatus Saccharimonadales bacterium]
MLDALFMAYTTWWILWPAAALAVALASLYCRLYRQLNPLNTDFDPFMIIIMSPFLWPLAIPVLLAAIAISTQEKRLRVMRNSRLL